MNFGVTMSSTIKIFPKHTELPYFIKAAELLAETIAAYFSRGLIQRFQRTQFLAIGLGYENYPDLAFRAQNTPGDAETLLFFQDKEQNNRIAQTFTDNVEYIDLKTANALVDIAAQCETNPNLKIANLVRQTRIKLECDKEPISTNDTKLEKKLSKSQRAIQSFLSGDFRRHKTA